MSKPQWLEDLEKPDAEIWKSRAVAEAKRALELEKKLAEAEHKLFWAQVHAVGNTSREAILAWAQNAGHEEITIGDELEGGDRCSWGYRVRCDGMLYKVAGREVPGGFVLSWCG